MRADNPVAQALYLSQGFEQIDLRRNYYPDDVDALEDGKASARVVDVLFGGN